MATKNHWQVHTTEGRNVKFNTRAFLSFNNIANAQRASQAMACFAPILGYVTPSILTERRPRSSNWSEIDPMFIQFIISRFALPPGGIDGITLRTTFKLTVPFEFLAASSKVEVSIPFTYDFDSGE